MIYSCGACKSSFHFKKQLHQHQIWSPSCGILKGFEGRDNLDVYKSSDPLVGGVKQEINNVEIKHPENPSSIVRLNVTEKTSIILVNCENLLDNEFYVKRSKKSKCGICNGCEALSDCMQCEVCYQNHDILDTEYQGISSTTRLIESEVNPSFGICIQRRCVNPIFNVSIIS